MLLCPPASRRFTSQRLSLHCAEWGDPGLPTLLLLHGGKDHGRSWDWTAEALGPDWHVLAPDLRGHGDSDWSPDGHYAIEAFVYDLAAMVHQYRLSDLTIVAHSLGGNIATRFAGLYPGAVRRLVSIEGLGPSPERLAEREAEPFAQRWRDYIVTRRNAESRLPRRYPSLGAALERMKAANAHLSEAQALHLTRHGLRSNEDGSFSWKFDPRLNAWPLFDLPQDEIERLWAAIECPVLLLYGAQSWASNPARDGRAAHFRNARVVELEGAGHWLHHDRFERFIEEVRGFIG